MSNKPVLSVIVAVYKAEKTLDRCLNSIFAQLQKLGKRDVVEVIAVNDASPDESGTVLWRHGESHPELKIVTHGENRHASGARNTGIFESCGEYFTFIDADDEYADGAIGKILDAIDKFHPDLIHYCYERVSPEGSFLSRTKFSMPGFHSIASEGEDELKAVFQETAFGIMTSGGVYRRAVAPDLHFDQTWQISEDRHFGWEFFRRCRNVFQIGDTLYRYYQYPDTVSRALSDEAVEGLVALDRIFWEEFHQCPSFPKASRYGFRRLFPGVVGWHFDLVFEDIRRVRLVELYFNTLNTYLGATARCELGVGFYWLEYAVKLKSRCMIKTYRTLFAHFLTPATIRLSRMLHQISGHKHRFENAK